MTRVWVAAPQRKKKGFYFTENTGCLPSKDHIFTAVSSCDCLLRETYETRAQNAPPPSFSVQAGGTYSRN
jgi:hypothetical protein